MAYMKIKGQVVSQPQVITSEDNAVVILAVKTDEVCKEYYCEHTIHSTIQGFAKKFVKSKFSMIVTSAIGDIVEIGVWSDTGEIDDFENITQKRKY